MADNSVRERSDKSAADLADTVQALGEKADVKSPIRGTVADHTAQPQRKASEVGHKVSRVTPDKAQSTGLTQVRSNPPIMFIPAVLRIGLPVGRRLGRRG